MTDMKQTTLVLPQELYDEIYNLRKEDMLLHSSFAGITRYLLSLGLKAHYRAYHKEKED